MLFETIIIDLNCIYISRNEENLIRYATTTWKTVDTVGLLRSPFGIMYVNKETEMKMC